MTWATLTDIFLFLAIIYLCYKTWKLRRRLEDVCDVMEENGEIAAGMLKTIKGWTVVNIERDKAHVEQVEKLIKPLASDAAEKVIEKLEEKKKIDSAHDSATLPAVKLPE